MRNNLRVGVVLLSLSVTLCLIILLVSLIIPGRDLEQLGPYITDDGTLLCEFTGTNNDYVTVSIYNTVEEGAKGKIIMHISDDFYKTIKDKHRKKKVPETKWIKLVQDLNTFSEEKLKVRVERF